MEEKMQNLGDSKKWQYQWPIQNEMVNISLRSFGILKGSFLSLQGLIHFDTDLWTLDSSSWLQSLEIHHGRDGENHTNTKKHDKKAGNPILSHPRIKWCGYGSFLLLPSKKIGDLYWFMRWFLANLSGSFRTQHQKPKKSVETTISGSTTNKCLP